MRNNQTPNNLSPLLSFPLLFEGKEGKREEEKKRRRQQEKKRRREEEKKTAVGKGGEESVCWDVMGK